jgi:hypothetical protein
MKGYLILVTGTIAMAAWTLFSLKWWLKKKETIPPITGLNWLFLKWFLASLVAVALIVVAPLFLLAELMSMDNNGHTNPAIALFGWIMPTFIFIVVYFIRQHRQKSRS